jgi:hypothetical protein
VSAGTARSMSFRSRQRPRASMPTSQNTKIAMLPTPSGPTAAVAGSRPLMTVIPTTQMTSVPSSAGTSEADAVDRGREPHMKRSAMTSTSVCIATPPIRLPAAISRCPLLTALTVIASSGRAPVIDSRTIPPMVSPRPKRSSSTSVAFASQTPAIHVATAAPAKRSSSAGIPRSFIQNSFVEPRPKWPKARIGKPLWTKVYGPSTKGVNLAFGPGSP